MKTDPRCQRTIITGLRVIHQTSGTGSGDFQQADSLPRPQPAMPQLRHTAAEQSWPGRWHLGSMKVSDTLPTGVYITVT